MKKIICILFICCLIGCKHNDALKSESGDMEMHDVETTDDLEKVSLSSEDISIKKFEEYIDLIKLKQDHPEFESDITTQLKNYSNSKLLSHYPKAFKISNIEQLSESKNISDSIVKIVLGYTVSTDVITFKDSILTEITLKEIVVDEQSQISLKVRFLPFPKK